MKPNPIATQDITAAARLTNVLGGQSRTDGVAATDAKAAGETSAKQLPVVNLVDRSASQQVVAGPATGADLRAAADGVAKTAARVDALFQDPDVRLALMDPNMVRTADYQRFVDGITSSSLYKEYHRDVRDTVKKVISHVLSESEVRGTVIDKSNVDESHLHLFTKPLHDLVQETARQAGVIGYAGGPNAVELKVLSNPTPNAYVYALWNESPRVHVHSAIVDLFFDNEKGEWVSEEAKLMLQSVIAHELWHIKDSPAEWRTWMGILVQASGLLDGHTDGPQFDAGQKAAMIAKGRAMLSDESAHEACTSGCCAWNFHSFFVDDKLAGVAKQVTSQLDISPEAATQALLDAFGINLETRRGIERDADGQATKFGILQAIFQDSYELTRAGEITADRGAFLVQGTNNWTAFIDYLLGAAVDFNSFSDSAAEKRGFMQRLLQKGYQPWVRKQSSKMAEQARAFNLQSQKDALNSVTHPPTLPRILLGMEYMDRFKNPEAYPLLVKELEQMDNPTVKTIEVLRLLHRAKHDAITHFVDPRGVDKSDATARVQQRVLYQAEQARWDGAIERAIDVLDAVVKEEALKGKDSKVFKEIEQALKVDKNSAEKIVVGAWAEVPMEQVTKYFIQRLEKLEATTSGKAKETVSSRLEAMWKLHDKQLKKETQVFSKKPPSVEDKLKDILKDISKPQEPT